MVTILEPKEDVNAMIMRAVTMDELSSVCQALAVIFPGEQEQQIWGASSVGHDGQRKN